MSRITAQRSRNRTIFISAEGDDEIGFLRWLRKARGQRNSHLVITFVSAHGGSNPQVVDLAARSDADVRACFMDTDRYLNNPEEKPGAESKAVEANVEILYSDPSFEVLLLGVFGIKPKAGKEKDQLRKALMNRSPQEHASYDPVLTVDMLRTHGKTNKTIERLLVLFELN